RPVTSDGGRVVLFLKRTSPLATRGLRARRALAQGGAVVIVAATVLSPAIGGYSVVSWAVCAIWVVPALAHAVRLRGAGTVRGTEWKLLALASRSGHLDSMYPVRRYIINVVGRGEVVGIVAATEGLIQRYEQLGAVRDAAGSRAMTWTPHSV